MGLIWDKGGAPVDEALMAFLAGEDVVLDEALLPYDLTASRAHVEGLGRVGVLASAEVAALCSALDALAGEVARGERRLSAEFEDGHSAIEAWLTERLGTVGKKVHTGRSRNDQVLVALALWQRDQLAAGVAHCQAAAEVALTRAQAEAQLPMPGYTHLQRAVPSSAGLWWASLAEAFIDDAVSLKACAAQSDACPLGTAAGYGVNLSLDRDGVAAALGFSRLLINPIYAQASRGRQALALLGVLGQALLTVRRLAWDLSLFTTAEFAFVALPEGFTTGSSLMPNKRNPDGVELLRAAYGVVAGARAQVEHILSLPSGYHRDLQATKGPTLHATAHALAALRLVPPLLAALVWRPEAMRAAITPELFATDQAVSLAVAGVPFRDAYRQVGQALPTSGDVEASLAARTSPGACADLRLDTLKARLAAL